MPAALLRLQEQRAHVPPQPQPLRLSHVLNTEERYLFILRRHLPAEAVEWVYTYADRHKLHLHVTRGRRSKLGDYRWPQPRHEYHEISVNGDLNPYLFFLVFLHEAAHLETHLKYTAHLSPHGHEWQAEYAALLLRHMDIFPEEVRPHIVSYTRHIPLQRRLGARIEELLHHYDKDYNPDTGILHLDDLEKGSFFRLKSRPDTLFRSVEHRRTRWLCHDAANARQYLISGTAEVVPES